MPGTGEAPIKIDVGAEKMYSSAIDYLLTRPDVDGRRLAVMGVSWGGYWGAILGFTEKDRLKATVDWAGPAHAYFQPEWQNKALGTREYLFDLFVARASVYGVKDETPNGRPDRQRKSGAGGPAPQPHPAASPRGSSSG